MAVPPIIDAAKFAAVQAFLKIRSPALTAPRIVSRPTLLTQRVEVDAKKVRIMGSKSVLLRTLVSASSAKTASFGVPSFVPKWRALRDSNPCFRRERAAS